MARSSPDLVIKEIGGNQYPDLQTAQMKALLAVASDLAATIRRLLAEGLLVNENGRIIPNPKRQLA